MILRDRFQLPPDGLFRAIAGTTLGLGLLFSGLIVFWGSGPVFLELPWYVPMVHSVAGLAALSVALLALGRYRVLRDPAAYWIGVCFASFGLLSVLFILAWPGVVPNGQAVIADLPSTSAWIAVLEWGVLSAFLLAAVLHRLPEEETAQLPDWSVAAWLVGVLLLGVLLVAFEESLSSLVEPTGSFSPLLLMFDAGFVLLLSAGAVLSTRRYRQTGDTLLGYLALTQVALVFVVLTALIGGKRHDLWFSLSGILLAGAFLTMLFGLLSGQVDLLRRERAQSHALEDANEKLVREVAERKLAEEHAAHQTRLLSEVHDAVFATDSQFRITHWNRAAEEMFGWSADEALGKETSELLQTQVPGSSPEQATEKLIRTGHFVGEVMYRTKSGDTITAQVRAAVVKGAEGELKELVTTVRDVTEHKRMDYALRQALENVTQGERKFSALFEKGAFAAAFSKLPDGVVVDVNEEWERLFGYSKKEAVGKTTLELGINPDAEGRARILAQLQAEGYARNQKVQLRTRSGEFGTFLNNVDLIDIAGDKFILSTIQDITERTRAEEALRAGEVRYRSLFESLPLITMVFQKRGSEFVATDCNHAAVTFSHQTMSQLIGRTAREIYASRPDIPQRMEQTLTERTMLHFEGPYKLATTGEEKYTVMTLAYVPPNRVLLHTEDITERKAAEEALQESLHQNRQLNEDLERRARELEATNYELEGFTYAVAHDLRAPLNLIEQCARLLAEDYGTQIPGGAVRLLSFIRDNATVTNRLAENLLTLSHTTRRSPQRETVNMREQVTEVVGGLKGKENGRTIDINIGDLPEAWADPQMIRQVWFRLIDNALKFTRKRSPACIEIGSQLQDHQRVYYVRDNGVGFDMAQVDRLFRAFQHLHHPDEYPGTGIGLVIVDRTIRQHGGKAWAEGEVNQGATFYFTLQEPA